MSLWTRIGKLFSKPAAPAAPKSMLDLAPGDICEVSLVTYEVTGRTKTSGRNAAVLTLRDGSQVAYLYVEEREELQYRLYHPIDGRLDSPSEVPATLELDDRMFYLEEEYEGYAAVTGQTPYMNGGEQHVWQYQSDDSRLLRVEWQNGRFMLYEGEAVIAADVRVIRGS